MQRASWGAGGARLLVLLYHCFFDEFGEGDWRVGAADYMTTFARFEGDLVFRTPALGHGAPPRDWSVTRGDSDLDAL